MFKFNGQMIKQYIAPMDKVKLLSTIYLGEV